MNLFKEYTQSAPWLEPGDEDVQIETTDFNYRGCIITVDDYSGWKHYGNFNPAWGEFEDVCDAAAHIKKYGSIESAKAAMIKELQTITGNDEYDISDRKDIEDSMYHLWFFKTLS